MTRFLFSSLFLLSFGFLTMTHASSARYIALEGIITLQNLTPSVDTVFNLLDIIRQLKELNSLKSHLKP